MLKLALVILVFVSGVVACETFSLRQPSNGQANLQFDENALRGIAATGQRIDKSGYAYDPDDRSCDGYPRLKVETAPGTCLGLVIPRDRAIDAATKKTFVMPRTIVQIPGTEDFLLVDMGGWRQSNGSLYRLSKAPNGVYGVTLLKFPLNNPHGLAVGPDGKFYIGERKTISRFVITNGKIANWEAVVTGLPGFEGHMHPLVQFAFDPATKDLYINAGAPSDHCVVVGAGAYASCPEETTKDMAGILRVPWRLVENPPRDGSKSFTMIAKGLRNSMAMAIHPSGVLIQGENSRDFSELEEPYEEINVVDLAEIKRGRHFGWPYCYDFHALAPEWKDFKVPVDCALPNARTIGDYQAPYLLVPPHAAPLSALFYKGAMFDRELGGKLLMTWHGYQPTGHRVVSYSVDQKGLPILSRDLARATYSFDQREGCPTQKAYKPHAGISRFAAYDELISKWNEVKGVRPKGAPVGMTVASDGSIWIVEDRDNRTVVRLARTQTANYAETCGALKPETLNDRSIAMAWRHAVRENVALDEGYKALQSKLVSRYCAGCHGAVEDLDLKKDRFSNLDFLMKNRWISAKSVEQSKLYQSISHAETAPPMPPGGSAQFFGTPEGQELTKLVEAWIGILPTDIEARVANVTMKTSRRVRNRASAAATQCGLIDAGQVVSIDPRESVRVKADGWIWVPVYLEPTHRALANTTCAWPEDGVFYTASVKAD